MQFGWSAPFIPILQGPDSPVKITDEDIDWLESIYMIGGLAGLPLTIYMVDRIGRQKTVLFASSSSFTAWILIGVANHVNYLYIARFLTGLAADVAFVAGPMYVAEIADQKIRGFLAGVIFLMMLAGFLILYGVAPYVPFYACSIIGGIIVGIQLVGVPFMPDSPYYLLTKGKHEKAKKHLQWLRGREDVDKELEAIAIAVERQKSERGRPQDLFISKSNRKAVIVMTVLNTAQHFSGMAVILMNLHSILIAAGSVTISSNVAGILFSAIMLLAATVSVFGIDHIGRRILLAVSSFLTGFALLAVAIFFTLQKRGLVGPESAWIPIVAILVYAAVFKCGLGIIPIVMTAELFPTKVKAMGMALADLIFLLTGLASIQLYQNLVRIYGLDVPFYIFAAFTLITAVFSIVYVPETKGKTLEEIQYILKGEQPPAAKKEGTYVTDDVVESPQ
ncbi:facilitated trehalose transporter Tret1-like isoform X2 [Anthonomus grandis grandis]|nr:facilitated trehalose transporter Tret1-like isoform X2 [Anthonomus grandis grandis]